MVGYYQQRVTASTGTASMGGVQFTGEQLFPYSRVAAIGPEVNVFIPVWKLWTQIRYNYEFMADNRAARAYRGARADKSILTVDLG